MSEKEIVAVVGDSGGWNAIEPPLLRALDVGCLVRVYLTATCGEQFTNGKLRLDKRMNVRAGSSELSDIAKFFGFSKHQLTVIGSSQSNDGTKASLNALALSHAIPRLSVQDMYGSSVPVLRKVPNAFECLCVTDMYAGDMLIREFPGLHDRIVVTGGPQFDRTIEIKKNWAEKRHQLREAMQVTDEQVVFLVVGGLNGTAEMLEVLEGGIKKAGLTQKAKVILRVHPRSTKEDQRFTTQYLDATTWKWFVEVDPTIAPTSEDLLPGVDFVLSGYSTTNYFGVLYEMPGVVYVGTPAFQRDLAGEKGLRRPPEVEVGVGWYVQTSEDMANVINAVQLGLAANFLSLQATQKSIASYNDGHATDRVWEQMQKLMTS